MNYAQYSVKDRDWRGHASIPPKFEARARNIPLERIVDTMKAANLEKYNDPSLDVVSKDPAHIIGYTADDYVAYSGVNYISAMPLRTLLATLRLNIRDDDPLKRFTAGIAYIELQKFVQEQQHSNGKKRRLQSAYLISS